MKARSLRGKDIGFAKPNGLWYCMDMMKRNVLRCFVAALLLAALLAGCIIRESEPTPTPEPTPTVDPHAGEVEVLQGGGGTMWVPERLSLRPFNRVATDFNVVNQIPYYAGNDLTMRRGIDVSDHQKQIDWQQVADYGIEFAIIRCGWRSYGEGNVNEDSRFRENIQGALDAGLQVGVYFFSQAVNIVEAAEEAVFALHLIEDYNVTLPVFYDWETIDVAPARTDELDNDTLTACALEFCRLVDAAGYEAGVYSYLNLAYYRYDLDQLRHYTLWMGDPGTKPIFYYDHDFWQYSFTATIPGIEVDVDLDAMYIKNGEEPVFRHPSPRPSPTPEAPEPGEATDEGQG